MGGGGPRTSAGRVTGNIAARHPLVPSQGERLSVLSSWWGAGSGIHGRQSELGLSLTERKGPRTAENRVSSRTPFCVSPQLCDDKLCSAVFIPWNPAWPHHCPSPEPGQEHGGLPAVAVGYPVGHEHEHRPGHQNQPLHCGPAGEDRAAPSCARGAGFVHAHSGALSVHAHQRSCVPVVLKQSAPFTSSRGPQDQGAREPRLVSDPRAESCVQVPLRWAGTRHEGPPHLKRQLPSAPAPAAV